MIDTTRIALNPLQYVATEDGWIDPTLAPPLEEQYAHIAAQGFRYVHCAVPADLSPAQYRESVTRHGLLPGPGYISLRWSDDADERTALVEKARATAAANAAAGSDVSFLSMAMGKDSPRVAHAAVGHAYDDDRFSGVLEHVARAAEAVRAEGVVPALHPHVGTWIETEAETRRALESIPSSTLAFGPDTGHLAWAGADVPAILHDYRDRIAGIHVKDYAAQVALDARATRSGYRETVMAGLWREPGTGDADLAAVSDALGAAYRGWTVIEVDRGFIRPPEASIAACAEWARSLAKEVHP